MEYFFCILVKSFEILLSIVFMLIDFQCICVYKCEMAAVAGAARPDEDAAADAAPRLSGKQPMPTPSLLPGPRPRGSGDARSNLTRAEEPPPTRRGTAHEAHDRRAAVVAARTDEGVPFGAGRRVDDEEFQERIPFEDYGLSLPI